MLIGISGKMGSGKTELAKIAERDFGYLRTSFGDEVKKEVMEYLYSVGVIYSPANFYGSQKDKMEELCIKTSDLPIDMKLYRTPHRAGVYNTYITYRTLMQWWGTEYRRAQDPNYWVNSFFNNLDFGRKTIIDDVRMENEAQMIRTVGGILIRVNWEGAANSNEHSSETALDNYPFFHLTISKPSNFTLEKCHSEYSAVLSKLLGDYRNEESHASEATATISG